MRLTCPNCDAQYEVPDEVVPTSGRDVQCSNCGQTWFQHHPDHMPPEEDEAPDEAEIEPPAEQEEAEETAPPPAPAPPAPEPQRRELDPAVADILRAEAEAEQQAREQRKQEAEALESQPDLGLDAGEPAEDDRARRALEAQRRMAAMRGEPDPTTQAAVAAAGMSSRRELLPDIEEINSTLRSDGERGTDFNPQSDIATGKRKGGFGRGFMLMIVLAVILAALYVYAPQIAQRVPALDGILTSYVGWIDTLRLGLDVQVQRLLSWLDALASQSAS